MNKTDLINAVAEKTGMTKVASKSAIEACFQSIQETLQKSEKVTLIGFGSFHVLDRKARMAKNPRTGKTVKVAAKKVVKFKTGTGLL
jgi:DNA-binding protein HU-beta